MTTSEESTIVVYADDLVRIRANNSSLMTGRGTNTWLIRSTEGWLVLDPGPADSDHVDTVLNYCDRNINTIVVTHTHQDHSPGVALLVDRIGTAQGGIYGALSPVGVGDTVEHYDLTFRSTVDTEDGTTIDLGGDRQLCAVHTPGHASNHFCWLLARSNQPDVLFSGDHIMDGSTVVIPPPDGDMSAYLESLARVRVLGAKQIAPGHGAMIMQPDDVIDFYIAHRLRREASIRDRLVAATTGLSINEIVVLEYVGLDDALLWAARYSVWAHLRRLQQLGVVSIDVDDAVDFAAAIWRLTI